jgi:cobyrinic acid a,c-diamide synthase
MQCPRIIIAGLNGGSGKTIISLGLARIWVRSGKALIPFKKGPDYIDAKWLGLAAGTSATNLDPYLLPKPVLRALFRTRMIGGEGALIEGNRGLFDGKDVAGSCSTAELARILDTPIILVMDCTKMTRTAAAVVRGMIAFEPGMHIAGVILNRTANDRHRAILRESIEQYIGVPVLGALPKLKRNPLPERHMGLISDQEYAASNEALDTVADLIGAHVDAARLWRIACNAPPLSVVRTVTEDMIPPENVWALIPRALPSSSPAVRIGYVRDAALWFYYEENLEALRRAGAELIGLSLLTDERWPHIDGLYLGGGFPETLAERLTANASMRRHVKALADGGLPIYAECGGMMYLGRDLVYKEARYPMAGVLPVTTQLCERPQGLGYVDAVVTVDNPFHPLGTILRGHEFHYSRCLVHEGETPVFGLRLDKGCGMGGQQDGIIAGSVFAAYTHLHALGERHWAGNFVRAAEGYRGKSITH